MSLRVWLPLTGHLDNQGLSGLTPVQTTAPTWVDGKLGKAMSTGALYLPANDVAKFYNNNAMSFAFWIYAVGSSGSSVILGQRNMSVGNNRMFTIFQYPSPNDLHLSWQSNESSTTFLSGILYGVFPSGTWTHCAITYDGAKATVYINGVYQTSWNGVSTRTNFTYDVPIPSTSIRYLNDIRIYDHALSPKEIKLLSQGLVCHYTLTGSGANPNLYTGTHSFTGTWGNSASWTTDTETFNGFIVKKRTGIWAGLYQNIPATINDIFTISFYAKRESGANVRSIHRSSLGNVTTGLSILGGNFETDTTWLADSSSNLDWKYCWATVQITSADITYLQWRIENSVASKTMWITKLKIEKGNKATPWIPNSSDAEYTTMGYSDTTVYDSSGYNYHMTAYGSPTISTNTVRNSVSTHFINGQYALAQLNSNVYLPKDAVTVNLWMNCSTWGIPISCTEGGGWNFENAGAGIQFPCYISGVGYKTANSGVAASTLLNAWHMLTGVFDGTSVKIYIDAELKATTATGSTNGIGYVANRLVISGEAAGATPASSTFVGEISDVKIYATPLSAEDIKALYQVGASIDKDGNLYAYELKEE